MTNNTIIDKLKKVLANNYALFLKTQNYHWNITGPNFISLHRLFEEQYDDLFKANDDIAERIRILGAKVPATFFIFSQDTDIKDGDENRNAAAMVEELAQDHDIMLKSLRAVLSEAQNIGDEGTVDLVTGRISWHEKTIWMLRSNL